MNHCRNRRTGIADPHPAKLIAILTALLVMPMAQADEGVFEINQTCAVNGGCFAGDDAGFPVEISDSGSYVLTSDLNLPADTHGLTLANSAKGSTIDLGGFTIRGPESCSGTPVNSCTGGSDVDGISGVDDDGQATVTGVTVKNGRVLGMSRAGIALGDDSRVRRVDVLENRLGISLGSNSTVEKTNARRNGGPGIYTGDASTVIGSRSSGNLSVGIYTGNGNTVIESKAFGNGGVAGMRVFDESLVVKSTARDNANQGFQVGNGGVLQSSIAVENAGPGIVITEGNALQVSSSRNGGYGIYCPQESAVQESVLNDNSNGSLSASCVELGENLCNGGTSC